METKPEGLIAGDCIASKEYPETADNEIVKVESESTVDNRRAEELPFCKEEVKEEINVELTGENEEEIKDKIKEEPDIGAGVCTVYIAVEEFTSVKVEPKLEISEDPLSPQQREGKKVFELNLIKKRLKTSDVDPY